VVEFDYRCRINGKYVIIDMQQWYKSDVIKRFYLYHTLNTGLQLEMLPDKLLSIDSKIAKSTKAVSRNYSQVDPVITLIWMVNDSFGFDDNYAEYAMQHNSVEAFLNDDDFWKTAAPDELFARK